MRFKKRFRSAFVLIVSLICWSPSALAYCRVPSIRPTGEFFKSDVVFTGKVISARYVVPGQDVGGWFYHVRAERIFRGPNRKEFLIYTEDSDIRLPLETGHEYLLFAYRNHGRLEIDNCGNSERLSEASGSIRSLEGIPRARNGEIEGWVVPETSGIDVSGIRVSVRGGSKTYRAVTDRNGWFHFSAPPGEYRVDFSSGHYYVNGGDVFWYDPDHFKLHAGETASLQLVSVRQPAD